ncbi:MAG TPA: hypothetical protein VFD72_04900 [Sphingobacteriaceae bacterium]|nr:hypothetical protein [Sphingobacteriaceae bacterium]
MNSRSCYTLCLLLILSFSTKAQVRYDGGIRAFQVKENLIKNDKLAIIATDSLGHPQESVNGTFLFAINGFEHELTFNEGVGIAPNKIESSVFVFIKHQNHYGSNGQLYYVHKSEDGINPIHINWYYLILIPLIIILIGYLFRRFLMVAIVVLIIWFVFNYSKGLDLPNFLDTIVHGLKEMVGS